MLGNHLKSVVLTKSFKKQDFITNKSIITEVKQCPHRYQLKSYPYQILI